MLEVNELTASQRLAGLPVRPYASELVRRTHKFRETTELTFEMFFEIFSTTR